MLQYIRNSADIFDNELHIQGFFFFGKIIAKVEKLKI